MPTKAVRIAPTPKNTTPNISSACPTVTSVTGLRLSVYRLISTLQRFVEAVLATPDAFVVADPTWGLAPATGNCTAKLAMGCEVASVSGP